MKRRKFLQGLTAATFTPVLSHALGADEAARDRANILFILADDLGWMDTGAYGSKYYDTPNIDRLAARGMLFTNAYAANPLCSPTRASIMTGKYPARLRFTAPAGHMPPKKPEPPISPTAPPHHRVLGANSATYLPHEEYTLAEAFRDAGYDTGFIGKWHLGAEPWWPDSHGFNTNIAGGSYPGPPSFFSPYHIKTIEDGPEGEYLTDRLTDEALAWLQQEREQPFFLCLWHYAVHSPFQAPEDMVEDYRDQKDPRGEQDCETMAAMIESMDTGIGRILDWLDGQGLAEKTLVVFMSDNGGNMYDTVHEFGDITTPTNNAPLRNGKGNIHEGGVRTPCIFSWPGRIPRGEKTDVLLSSIDFYPTLLELAGISQPSRQLVDGISLAPLLTAGEAPSRDAIFCHFPHQVAATGNLPSTSVRQGPWKLIRFYGQGPEFTNSFALYNLDEDIGESNNLAEAMPDKVRALDKLIDRHLKDTDAAIPVPNPGYDPDYVPLNEIPPVAGWRPAGGARAEVRDGRLIVESTGQDPNISCVEFYRADSPLSVRVRMQSDTEGKGALYWGPTDRGYRPQRRVDFDMVHDGVMREYEVGIPGGQLVGSIRIDPGVGKGQVEIESIRILKPSGDVVKAWDFEQ